MKKLAAVVVLSLILVMGAVVSLLRDRSGTPTESHPFEKSFRLDKATALSYLDNDSADTVLGSGRFYWGARPLPGNLASEYDAARSAKIAEILKLAARVRENATIASQEARRSLTPYYGFLDVLRKQDPRATKGASRSAGALMKLEVGSTVSRLSAESLAGTATGDTYAAALIQEMTVYRSATAGCDQLQLFETFLGHSALASLTAEAHPDPKVNEAGASMSQALANLDSWKAALKAIAEDTSRIHDGLRQLETSDTLYGRAAVGSIKARIDAVMTSGKRLQPGNGLTQADIDYANELLALIQHWNNGMDRALEKPVSHVRAPRPRIYGVGVAWAADDSSYRDACASLFDAMDAKLQVAEAVGSATLDSAKGGFRKLQRGIQFGTDYLATGVSMTTRLGLGVYYGDSAEQIKADLKKMGGELRDNWNGKLPKKTTLRQAKELMDEMEDTFDKAARTGAEGVFGEGWKSWMVGKAAKMVMGAFNGLAKGIYLVGDPSSSAGDYVEGSIEILFASLGGTKSLVKASQLKGLAGEGAQLAKQGWSVLGKSRIQAQIARLTELIGKEGAENMGTYLSNLRELAAARQSLEALDLGRQALSDRIKALIGQGFRQVGSASAESLEDLVKLNSAKGLEGVAAMLASATGATRKEIFDNLMASVADDLLETAASDLLRDRIPAAEVSGTYSGTTRIEDVQVNKEEAKKIARESKDEGCMNININDAFIENLEKMKGSESPGKMHVRALSDSSGTLTISGQGSSSPTAIKYSISDSGELEASATQKGFDVDLTGKFVKEQGTPTKFLGRALISGKGFKIGLSMTFSK